MDKLLELQKLDAKNDDSVVFAISWGSCGHHSCNSGLDPDGDK
ncbi:MULTISPECIES: hypothetical protein [unclassified Treponema]|nr:MULTISPECIES: hypothetical protein [unclassified Treponema]